MTANLEWFKTFRAIYETGSMSGAARELYVSQPGVGLHLNALEAYTGFPLFERTARKMIPTEKGALLYQQMIPALITLEGIETRFKRKSGDNRATISVGMCIETFQQVLEKHLPSLDFNLMMQFGNNEQLIQSLENGSVDLILTTTINNSSSLVFQSFATERLILVAGKQTDISGFKRFVGKDDAGLIDWLRAQIWYSTAADMAALNRFWEINLRERPGFIPNYIVPNQFSITRCLSAGGGLAILPGFLGYDAIRNGKIIKLWEGGTPVEDTLYFGKRKQPLNFKEIAFVEHLLIGEFKAV